MKKKKYDFKGASRKHREWGCLIFDFLGRPFTWFFAKYTSVTPNQVSFSSLILCVIGAYFLFLGGYKNVLIGASIAFLGNIFDMVDGCLARAKGTGSLFGRWMDAMIDFTVFPLLVFALAVGLKSKLALILGMLAIMSYPTHYLIIHYYKSEIVKNNKPMEVPGGGKYEWLRDVYGSNLFYLFLFIGAIFNVPILVLVFWATFGNLYWVAVMIVQYMNIKKIESKGVKK